jgi:hypothetical protein
VYRALKMGGNPFYLYENQRKQQGFTLLEIMPQEHYCDHIKVAISNQY